MRITYVKFFASGIYFEKLSGYTDNIKRQMDTARRIKLIRMIEKIEKNPKFSSKICVRNASEFIAEKRQKK